jgi:hypothetical protein
MYALYLVNVHLSSPGERTVVVATEYKDGVVVRVTVARTESSQETGLVSL